MRHRQRVGTEVVEEIAFYGHMFDACDAGQNFGQKSLDGGVRFCRVRFGRLDLTRFFHHVSWHWQIH
nr:hypothetical protein [Streptomyces europaeiscabiei]